MNCTILPVVRKRAVRMGIFLAVVTSLRPALPAQVPSPLTVEQGERLEESLAGETSPRRTFLDAMVVEQSQGLTRVFHSAEKHSPNPVLMKDKPWEGWGPYLYGTVLREAGKFKMWYTCIGEGSGFVCFAESANGLDWTKPNLGIHEYKGSTENNIIGKIVEPGVIQPRGAKAHPQWVLFSWAGPNGATAAFSDDGLHWDWEKAKPKLFSTSDVVNFFYDPYNARYVASFKTPSRRHRAVGVAFSTNGLDWTKPIVGPVFTADDLDPDATQIYGMPIFPYQGMYIGLPWMYHARFFKYGEYSVDRLHEAQIESPRTVDVQFAWSWDLISWTRPVVREPFIALGEDGSWDDGMIFTARAPVIAEGKLFFYYGGFDRVHDDYKGIRGGIGLATLRLDGFCSMRAGEIEGKFISRREVFKSPAVFINGRVQPGGYITADLLDKSNRVIPGFSRIECVAFSGDSTAHLLHWNIPDLPNKTAQAVKKIRFYLKNADLYSYWPKDLDTTQDQGNREAR